jgi:hypothetical protein
MEFDTLARRGVTVVGGIGDNGIWALDKNPMESLYDCSGRRRPANPRPVTTSSPRR